MAADNDDAYNLTPAFILETVEVARSFVLGISKSKSVGNVTNGRNPEHHLHVQIAAFLAWPQERVKHALAQLAAFEPDEETKEPTLSREAVKQLPTLHAATVTYPIHAITFSTFALLSSSIEVQSLKLHCEESRNATLMPSD